MIARIVIATICLILSLAETILQAQTPDYFAVAEISNSSPYVNEQLIFSIRYYAHLPRLASISYPEFSGFWLIESGAWSNSRIETVDNRQYNVREVFVTLAPLQAGSLMIDRAQLEISEDVFNQGYLLLTEPVELNVLPLPENAPEGFNGAVGQFHVVKEVDVEEITLGQPVHLTITVDGVGNLEHLPMPQLPHVESWRAYPNQPRYVEGIISGLSQKIFEWVLIPERSGTQTYPPIVFSYFDPVAGDYNSIVLDDTVIDVFPGAGNLNQLPELATNASDQNRLLPLKTVAGLSSPSVSTNLIRMIWLIVPFLAGITVGLYLLRTTEYQRQQAHQRSGSYRKSIRQMTRLSDVPLQKTGDDLERIVRTYIAEKTEQDSSESIETLIEGTALESALKQQVALLFEAINNIRYAPEQGQVDVETVIKQALTWVTMLESVWDKQ